MWKSFISSNKWKFLEIITSAEKLLITIIFVLAIIVPIIKLIYLIIIKVIISYANLIINFTNTKFRRISSLIIAFIKIRTN